MDLTLSSVTIRFDSITLILGGLSKIYFFKFATKSSKSFVFISKTLGYHSNPLSLLSWQACKAGSSAGRLAGLAGQNVIGLK